MAHDVIIDAQGSGLQFAGFPVSGGGAPPEIVDTEGPVVQTISPPEGTLLQPEDRVEFEVVDSGSGLAFAHITANFDSGGVACNEVVYTGTQLGSRYLAQSIVTEVPGGLNFFLRRVGGWPGDVVISITAFDNQLQSSTEVVG